MSIYPKLLISWIICFNLMPNTTQADLLPVNFNTWTIGWGRDGHSCLCVSMETEIERGRKIDWKIKKAKIQTAVCGSPQKIQLSGLCMQTIQWRNYSTRPVSWLCAVISSNRNADSNINNLADVWVKIVLLHYSFY